MHRFELNLVHGAPVVEGLVQLNDIVAPIQHGAVVLKAAQALQLRNVVLPVACAILRDVYGVEGSGGIPLW